MAAPRWGASVGASRIRRSGVRYMGDQYHPIPTPLTASRGSASRGSGSSRNPFGVSSAPGGGLGRARRALDRPDLAAQDEVPQTRPGKPGAAALFGRGHERRGWRAPVERIAGLFEEGRDAPGREDGSHHDAVRADARAARGRRAAGGRRPGDRGAAAGTLPARSAAAKLGDFFLKKKKKKKKTPPPPPPPHIGGTRALEEGLGAARREPGRRPDCPRRHRARSGPAAPGPPGPTLPISPGARTARRNPCGSQSAPAARAMRSDRTSTVRSPSSPARTRAAVVEFITTRSSSAHWTGARAGSSPGSGDRRKCPAYATGSARRPGPRPARSSPGSRGRPAPAR